MSETDILYLLLGILTLDFVLESGLGYLNFKSSKSPIPKKLDDIYEEEAYNKSQDYHRATWKLSSISSIFFFVITFCALALGWFGLLDGYVRALGPMDLISSLLFFGLLFVISDLLSMPFGLYGTFVIEEKFGFNKMTAKTYVMDKVKGYLLTIIIGGLLLAGFLALVAFMGKGFWLYFWGVITVFILFMNMFYTSWLLPLFNKLTPLEEGELKSSITTFSKKVGFPLKNIFVMDGSKRSSKGNAFFSGLGKQKKVVLFDTLIDKHSIEELTAVFAHEVGHFKKRHIILGTGLSILQVGLMLFLLSRMIFAGEVSFALGGEVSTIHLNALAFFILYSPLSRIISVFMNILSRKNEYEADAYAAENYSSQPLIAGLKKMSADHLSNLTPHPAYVFIHYSHPPLLQRIQAMESLKN